MRNFLCLLSALLLAHAVVIVPVKRMATPPEVISMKRQGNTVVPFFDSNGISYFGNITVGTPGKIFTMVYDTGSSVLWIPNVNCLYSDNTACTDKNLYNHQLSSTYTANGNTLAIQYGTGQMSGILSYDTVSLGGIPVTGQIFGEANSLAVFFKGRGFDGILGLAFQALYPGITPVFDNMMTQGLVSQNVFSVYLDNKNDLNSVLILGGIDSRYYTGAINYFPLVKNPIVNALAYYSVLFNGITINGVEQTNCTAANPCTAIIDTGSSNIIGVNNLAAAIPFSNTNAACKNLNQLPTLEITFQVVGGGTAVLPVPPSSYVAVIQNNVQCQLGISQGSLWIFGDAFIRNYYTIFDRSKNQVGVAALSATIPAAPTAANPTQGPGAKTETQPAATGTQPAATGAQATGTQPSLATTKSDTKADANSAVISLLLTVTLLLLTLV